MYSRIIKRFFDLLAASLIVLLMLPILILVTILLLVSNKGKVFFVQDRPGIHEKIFRIIKFKTMNDKRDSDGNLLSDKERMTVIGEFIRKTSLDEFPQLLNVIKGEMSIVGPRPLLVQYLQHYNNSQKMRHKVKPGITGWAQVNGRNTISWAEKFNLDIYYVENQSFLLDFKILIKTILKVILSSDINVNHTNTMPLFTGNTKED